MHTRLLEPTRIIDSSGHETIGWTTVADCLIVICSFNLLYALGGCLLLPSCHVMLFISTVLTCAMTDHGMYTYAV